MTPKFTQLLEQCILDGVILGHKRAYKHNDAPSESDINQSIVNEVLNEYTNGLILMKPNSRRTHDTRRRRI